MKKNGFSRISFFGYSNGFVLLLWLILLLFVVMSKPFLKLPYDMWSMLLRISSYFHHGVVYLFYPENIATKYCNWAIGWGYIFRFLGISSPFLWAQIIHSVQTALVFGGLLFFCYIVYRTLGCNERVAFFLAFLALLQFLLGTGTFSCQYQQSWLMWYSVNYQAVSFSFYWLMITLTIILVYHKNCFWVKVVLSCLIIALGVTTLVIHSMEAGYYCLFLVVLVICNLRKWKCRFTGSKTQFLIVCGIALALLLPCLLILLMFIKRNSIHFPNHLLELFDYPLGHHLSNIIELTRSLNAGLNRFPWSFSELAIFSLVCGIILCLSMISFKKVKSKIINGHLIHTLLAYALLMFLIPLIPGVNGFFGFLTSPQVVYRFSYASVWFVFVPLASYYVITVFHGQVQTIKLFAVNSFVIILFLVLSKYCFYRTAYSNAKSLIDSFDRQKVGLQYSEACIQQLRTIIDSTPTQTKKPIIYQVRIDLAPLVAVILNKNVFCDNRFQRIEKDCQKNIDKYKTIQNKYEVIRIQLNADFPKDKQAFNHFWRD